MIKNIIRLSIAISLSISTNSYASDYSNLKTYYENEEISKELNNRKIQLLILPFKGWNGVQEKFYQEMSNKLLEKELGRFKKFDIINDENFYNTVNSINIDENKENILNFARDKQIKYIVIPKFKENSLDFNDLSFTQDQFTQGRKIVFQIEILDVSSGEIIYKNDKSLVQTRKIFGTNFYSMLEKEFNKEISYLAQKIDENFLIKAKIINKQEKITLDKGSNDGINVGMIFTLKNQEKTKNNFNYITNSYFRVTEVFENNSNLNLLSGKLPNNDTEVTESKNNPNFGGLITEFNNNVLTINLGEDEGVDIGQVYKVSEIVSYKDSKTGKEYTIGDKEKGLILITETEKNTSLAKIIRGGSEIKNGMKISEYKNSYLEPFVKMAYYFYKPITANVNKDNVLRLSTGFQEMRYQYFFDFGLDASMTRVNLSDTVLYSLPLNSTQTSNSTNTTISPTISGINGSVGYNFPIIPEYIYIAPMIQAGFALSDNQNRNVVFDITPKALLKINYSRFNLWLEGGFSANIGLRQNNLPNTSSFVYGGGLSIIF